MKKAVLISSLFLFGSLMVNGQEEKSGTGNTLLWRISGKDITTPSYLFGTIHMICADDIVLSDSLVAAIRKADRVYLELDMDNLFEMIAVMGKMKMRDDTTLADLLTEEEYTKVRDFFNNKGGLVPFSIIETYKPLLASSMIMQFRGTGCTSMTSMEELVMKEAKKRKIPIKGLETLNYQLSIFDSIPYGVQARQLVKMIESDENGGEDDMKQITEAYRRQQLDQMEELTRKEDMGISNYTELLLYRRNENWAKKLDGLMGSASLVIAVGAGHLPGEKGVINLLRKMGYTVEPVLNKMTGSKTKQI